MDLSLQSTPAIEEKDEWDTDGFEIPSFGIDEEPDQSRTETPETPETDSLKSSSTETNPKNPKREENIYLGPHGAPPSQPMQQELNPSGRKQRFKQKLKEADKRISAGRENKLENLRELVGGAKSSPGASPKGSSREWLDPHCHESEFEKWSSQ